MMLSKAEYIKRRRRVLQSVTEELIATDIFDEPNYDLSLSSDDNAMPSCSKAASVKAAPDVFLAAID